MAFFSMTLQEWRDMAFLTDYALRHPWKCRKNRKCAKCRRWARLCR